MIQPILVCPERQRVAVHRLVDYCFKLDGTVVKIVPVSEESDARFMSTLPESMHREQKFACLQAFGFRQGALSTNGEPFIWLEPDSIPLKPGWVKRITEEYKRVGKPILISSDSHPPDDLVGGIGVYSGDAGWLIPTQFKRAGFDLWMLKHIPELVGKTGLIQHKYGHYGPDGRATELRFPKDRSIIRENTLIFHRDKHQDLIGGLKIPRNRFHHTGDLGDIIAALPIIRQMGGGSISIGNHRGNIRPMKGVRFDSIAPLLEDQSYITSVKFDDSRSDVTTDFSDFRNRHYNSGRTLTHSQGAYVGVHSPSMSPWLEAIPSRETSGKVVISRSQRYHNQNFPWREVVERYGNRSVFVGMPEEHRDFCRHVGRRIPYLPTSNLKRLASLISGSDLFIGNQSSPCWIAMGLGHPMIQETHPQIRDSIVQRPNARFVDSGSLPDMSST